jgi:hypothetical protein
VRSCAGDRKLCGIVRRPESVRDCAEAGAPFVIRFPASRPIAGRMDRIIVIVQRANALLLHPLLQWRWPRSILVAWVNALFNTWLL